MSKVTVATLRDVYQVVFAEDERDAVERTMFNAERFGNGLWVESTERFAPIEETFTVEAL